MTRHILALDQGTTSTRAIVFDRDGAAVASARRDLTQYYPADGWVEHDAAEIRDHAVAGGHEALVRRKTGLLLDPYFSATKVAWTLEHAPGCAPAPRPEICASARWTRGCCGA
ncbi:FGGY family of carbohydrate kinases, N-terminal domain [Rhodospira trueperi]|uniref:FGGY family of carbohydrate kinases, N-terminal domain n=1 Tax=Rhodospira trueperi TaxID=69960 RepID=A0A1G7DGL3_9PROT|nr:FGGY family of carbohydrate kinases, N-terminal domain [Rhodospira trueperi]